VVGAGIEPAASGVSGRRSPRYELSNRRGRGTRSRTGSTCSQGTHAFRNTLPRKRVVRAGGLEPPASRVRGERSSPSELRPDKSDREDSNLQPSVCDTAALPLSYDPKAPAPGFEPGTSPLTEGRSSAELRRNASGGGRRTRTADLGFMRPLLSPSELCRRRVSDGSRTRITRFGRPVLCRLSFAHEKREPGGARTHKPSA
jgi:hypothetical protein